MGPSPLSGEAQEVLIGVLLGVGVALPGQYLFPWRNLRWTWALFAVPIGGLALLAGIVESWSVAFVLGGLVTARWAYVLERRDVESGGDARRRARDAVGPVDVLAKRRSLRQARQGNVTGRGEFLLGHNQRSRPVSLRFGGASGRHGLLLGASGSGKSNALLWCPDLAVLRVDPRVAGPITEPFPGQLVSNYALGEDFMAYGYPEDVYGPNPQRPAPRLFKGHYQRFMGHRSQMGYSYPAAELSVGCPAGLSGGPLFRPGAHSVVVAVATENIESTTGADFEEEVTGEARIVYRRVLTYGVAVLLEPLRDWLAEVVPEP